MRPSELIGLDGGRPLSMNDGIVLASLGSAIVAAAVIAACDVMSGGSDITAATCLSVIVTCLTATIFRLKNMNAYHHENRHVSG